MLSIKCSQEDSISKAEFFKNTEINLYGFETPFFQFWAAFVHCDKQFRDAFRFTAQQIDVIKRLAEAYPEDMDFVTTAAGDLK